MVQIFLWQLLPLATKLKKQHAAGSNECLDDHDVFLPESLASYWMVLQYDFDAVAENYCESNYHEISKILSSLFLDGHPDLQNSINFEQMLSFPCALENTSK